MVQWSLRFSAGHTGRGEGPRRSRQNSSFRFVLNFTTRVPAHLPFHTGSQQRHYAVMLREQMAAAAAPAGGRPAAGLRPGRDAHCGWPLSRAAVGWRCRCAGAQHMRCTGHGGRALDAHWLSTGCRQRRAHSTKERRRRLSPSRRIARRSAQVRLRGRRRPQPACASRPCVCTSTPITVLCTVGAVVHADTGSCF